MEGPPGGPRRAWGVPKGPWPKFGRGRRCPEGTIPKVARRGQAPNWCISPYTPASATDVLAGSSRLRRSHPPRVTYAAMGSWDHKDVRRPFICLATRGSGATPTRCAHTSGGCGEFEAGTRPGARPLDLRTHDANIPAGPPRHNSRFCDRDGRHSPHLASREASA
jgi:hypothetical protein